MILTGCCRDQTVCDHDEPFHAVSQSKYRAVMLSGGRNRQRLQQEYFRDWTSVSHHGKLKSQHTLVTFRWSRWESRRLPALKHPQSCSFTPPDQNTLTLLALTDTSLFSTARCKWLGDCSSGREINGVPFVWCFLFSGESSREQEMTVIRSSTPSPAGLFPRLYHLPNERKQWFCVSDSWHFMYS